LGSKSNEKRKKQRLQLAMKRIVEDNRNADRKEGQGRSQITEKEGKNLSENMHSVRKQSGMETEKT